MAPDREPRSPLIRPSVFPLKCPVQALHSRGETLAGSKVGVGKLDK
jgi:hypothetical protein